MKDELTEIFNAIQKAWGVDKWTILNGKTDSAILSRQNLCFVINKYYPHLISNLEPISGLNRENVYKLAEKFSSLYAFDSRVAPAMKRISRRLNLIPRKKRQTPKRVVSCTKQLFGFDYTEEEELMYQKALEESEAFWERMSRIGRPPMEDGMVISLKGGQSYRSWYNQ